MTRFENRLAADREIRSAARSLFTQRLEQVKSDLSARGIAGRIKYQAQEKAFDTADYAIDIAKDNKAVIVATGGALALWFLRRPLIAAVAGWFGQDKVQDEPAITRSDQDEEHKA